MTTKNGVPTGAVFGFLSMLLKLIAMEPQYLLVAFDMHGPTFRHETYAAYKAGRQATPDDLRTQFPLLKQVLGAMGICQCECERYEADDILGTFSRMANAQGVDALLVTGDRDALQLITPQTHVLMTHKGISETVEYDEAALLERYGLTPNRMPDLKGLMGDASDNLPGIPGVGEKTAQKLLEKYGTMENALQNAAQEKGALRQKLETGGESARMSYRLGLIDTAAPVTTSLADCALYTERFASALPLLRELELRAIINRLPGGDAPPPPPVLAVQAKTIMASEEAALAAAVQALNGQERLAVTLGEHLYLCAEPDTQYKITLGGATLFEPGLDEAATLRALRPLLEDAGIEKIVFDAKRLRHVLARYGVELCGGVQDAMIQDYLLHAIHPAGTLTTLCAERGTSADAAGLLGLSGQMLQELREKGMEALYTAMELPLVGVLYDMERIGFAVDRTVLDGLSQDFAARLAAMQRRIYELAGEEFNILSPKQLGGILFEKLGLPPQKKTKSGYSTDAEVLEAISELHPIVPLLLEYRFLAKLKSTFIDGLLALLRPEGRIHTSFNQNVTATGRISSAEPNLQNIPVRTEQGREIRRAFVSSPGNLLVGADYSQIELRLLAHMSGDAAMIDAFLSGVDIHARTASEVLDVPVEQVTGAQRSAAKAVNFGIVYGISDYGLARNIGVSRKEAGAYIAKYFERYPGVHAFMQQCVKEGRQAGYAKTLLGRRRELPELRASNFNTRSFGERVAMNMPIQGTAADIIKLAMVRVHAALQGEGLRAKLILQIHDELIIDTPEAEVARVEPLLRACMQDVMQLRVPLLADVRVGKSWYDTK
jgi:DNA polymerase-1